MRPMRSLALAVALAAAGATLAPAAAMAAPVTPAAVTMPAAVNASNIDPTTPTSLTVHKYLGAPTGAANDGSLLPTAPALPALQGVAFDVYNVAGVDLTTNAGWSAATALQGHTITPAEIAAGQLTVGGSTYALTKAGTVTTDATGATTFTPNGTASQPRDGLYLVNENLGASTNVKNIATNAAVPTNSITPSSPFLVTLPMTDPSGKSWMYDVNAYPKNTSDSITKSVTDLGVISTAQGGTLTSNASSLLQYTLDSTITPGLTGTQMGTYVVADKLPAGTTFSSVPSVAITGTAPATLTAGTDYTIYVNGSSATPLDTTADAPTVQIVMTAAGLDKLAAAETADPASKVEVKLNATAKLTTGTAPNTAYLIPSNAYWATQHPGTTYNPPTDNPDTGVPSNDVTSKFGDAMLTKTDAKNDKMPLPGAVFDLYSGVVAGDPANPKPADCSNIVTDATKKVMTGLTTNESGQVDIKGLEASNFYNNTQQPATGGQYIVYCLVETQAPTVNGVKYNLNAEPTAFYITAPATGTTIAQTAVGVQDEPTNLTNSLPLTGGSGAAVLSVGGLVVVGATLAARAASRKRREDDDADLA